ncbi:hypothetical protein SS1G_08458 [Paecilomyces variotii No. 5]|uniref:Maltose/galactoside acetyltransferase domain-containing protein n=1 Tax=Byssochlamys spectabilis (strain No. 5 / NBRC 109023) TaxID=1356009 RepID=V5FFB2_BYSSN|nr:hypothetical protein SS1G_08458 [Paecilomyces variotii No. 5]
MAADVSTLYGHLSFVAQNAAEMLSSGEIQDILSELKESDTQIPWCDEYYKMISGMKFTASRSVELQQHKLKTLRQLNDFNDMKIPNGSTLASLKTRRMSVAKTLLGKLGEVNIEQPFFVGIGCNTLIGDDVYINRDASLFDNAFIRIGNDVLIGPGVCICTSTHRLEALDRREDSGTSIARPIIIQDDCWAGAGATILAGVRVGAGTTIAAGAVVTCDIEPGSVVGGVPARVIRKLDGVQNMQ